MKKTFNLVGLDCANCAAKIQNAVNEVPEIKSASVNFMTTKMNIEAEGDNMNSVVEIVKVIVKEIEPDVIVVEKA
ncbi:heavy metal transporter [Clostridium botulinum]|uniref:Heavy metal transporter n=1 Tax=Clostridium botulinum TaxID=1491 RepID=A0A6B4K152_CLOBO|nr:heavy metal transporter [Clostridium botulinum]NFD85784.1 heavy metal transporter [Clostridium botulinum]NFE07261.1 heavy metal transporter [Clostridium botulinum]NFE35442.1 heavy metal transporter [Clostridium botulinum]NFE49713.1 heavy metal transporter [Clostridium botulinum]